MFNTTKTYKANFTHKTSQSWTSITVPCHFHRWLAKCIFFIITMLLVCLHARQILINNNTSPKDKEDKTTEIKYILLWTSNAWYPFNYLGEGQSVFISNNCPATNCYITTDRKFLDGDLTKFDAIMINGRNINLKDLPKHRSQKQKYIYVNSESADNNPLCDARYDDYFNWTFTYRIDSELSIRYISIKDQKGRIVGPNKNMEWIKHEPKVEDLLGDTIQNKSKAAVWFVSHCVTRSGREKFVKRLQASLKQYGYSVDVIGACGNKTKCPKQSSECDKNLGKDYFFYMSLENSFDEDYVTEKLLKALQLNIVPIVYGGANYSRFLPPGSYINAREYTAPQLAALMNHLTHSPQEYSSYFWWKPFYNYYSPQTADYACSLCAALNNQQMMHNTSSYAHFRKWWNPNYKKRCKNIKKS